MTDRPISEYWIVVSRGTSVAPVEAVAYNSEVEMFQSISVSSDGYLHSIHAETNAAGIWILSYAYDAREDAREWQALSLARLVGAADEALMARAAELRQASEEPIKAADDECEAAEERRHQAGMGQHIGEG